MATRGSRQFYLRYRNRRKPLQNKLYNDYYSVIKSVFVDVLHNLENGVKELPSVKSIKDKLIGRTKVGYRMVATAGFRYGLEDAQEKYGRPLPVLVEKAISDEELGMLGLPTVVQRIQGEAMEQVVTIPESLRGKLRIAFEESARAMEGRPELSRRIRVIAEGDYPTWMANRIAQTETTRAFNNATLMGYEKSTVVMGKEWVSNLMGNPRHPPESEFDHRAAHGEKARLNNPFVATGEPLMYPGDYNGSPGNVINCHCGMMPVTTIAGMKPSIKPAKPPKVKPETEGFVPTATPGSPEYVEQTLTSGEITKTRKLGAGMKGVNVAEKIKIKDDGEAIFKPGVGENSRLTANVGGPLYVRERAAYLINKELGLDDVPVTVVRTKKGVEGSAQLWMDVPRAGSVHNFWELDFYKRELGKMNLFDNLIDNGDRHSNNFLVDIANKKLVYIDNGFSLRNTKTPHFILREASEFIKDIDTEYLGKYYDSLSSNILGDGMVSFVNKLKDEGLEDDAITNFFKRALFQKTCLEEELKLRGRKL